MPLAHLGKSIGSLAKSRGKRLLSHNGKDYQLAVNDSVSHTAIHGLLAWRDWQINQQSASEVSLTIFLPPSYGYPFALVSEVIYRLEAIGGLHVFISAQNIGDNRAVWFRHIPI
jgi:aldose 1-epimerase